VSPYCYSKVEAERAAWRFMEENEGKLSFDLVVVNPEWIIGPIIQDLNLNPQLNESMVMLLQLIKGIKNGTPIDVNGYGVVDVRDVAAVHILCGESVDPRVPNNRYIASNGSYSLPDIARMLKSMFPDYFDTNLNIVGDEEYGKRKRLVQLIQQN
jgi:nucleoside-diphosphate-sugar epimerase